MNFIVVLLAHTMASFVKIEDAENDVSEYPLDKEGHLSLEVLQSVHPHACGLVYTIDGHKKRVVVDGGQLLPLPGGWKDQVYKPSLLRQDTSNRDQEVSELREKVERLATRPPPPPPHLSWHQKGKCLHYFDGRTGEVDEFISLIQDAMPRYGIPEEEKGPYITDFLRGVPKAEAKAFLQEGKSAQDLLDFLHDSFAGGQALGELQHQFLERKQKRGEDMRDFAVDLEKRFLKLTRREPNLYSDPNSILVEQFVEGI